MLRAASKESWSLVFQVRLPHEVRSENRVICRMHAFYDHRVEGTDGNHGILQLTLCDLKAVVNEAERLSALHTLTGSHRSFDILHRDCAYPRGNNVSDVRSPSAEA